MNARVQQLCDRNRIEAAESIVELASRDHLVPSSYADEMLKLHRFANELKRKFDQKYIYDIAAYQARERQAATVDLETLNPTLRGTDVHVDPLETGLDCRVVRIDDRGSAAKCAVQLKGFCERMKRKTTLGAVCEQNWQDMSAEIKPDKDMDAEVEATDVSDMKPSHCFLAGMCIACSDEGRQLKRMRDSLLNTLKEFYPVGGNHRHKLKQRKLFMRLDFAVDRSKGIDVDLEAWGYETLSFHISDHSYAPYQSMLHQMYLITDDAMLLEANASDEELPLQARVFLSFLLNIFREHCAVDCNFGHATGGREQK